MYAGSLTIAAMFVWKRSGRTLRRFGATLCIVLIAAGTFAAGALAYGINYGPYQYWATGANANSVYDTVGHRWYINQMYQKSCGGLSDCWARVTFIKSDGSWWDSWTDETSDTEILVSQPQNPDFSKKAYCANNANWTYYYAVCYAAHG
jgi:hypothetical protein